MAPSSTPGSVKTRSCHVCRDSTFAFFAADSEAGSSGRALFLEEPWSSDSHSVTSFP